MFFQEMPQRNQLYITGVIKDGFRSAFDIHLLCGCSVALRIAEPSLDHARSRGTGCNTASGTDTVTEGEGRGSWHEWGFAFSVSVHFRFR